ncbi:cache domain-containing protein [bacterium]|nr:cache domain-containing protein [bacterium]
MNRTTCVDFHCHSNLSDGYFAPEVLAHKLADAGVHYAALTDHDTVEGLDRFQQAAQARGMGAIAGVELSLEYQGHQIHLLAYGFDPAHEAIRALLGLKDSVAAVIQSVHRAGGIVFLAHPIHIGLEWERLDEVLVELKSLGLDGVEAYFKSYTPAEQTHLAQLAEKHHLLTTGGSDFHGPALAGPRAPGIAILSPDWKRFREALGKSLTNGRGTSERPTPQARTPQLDWNWFFLRIVLPALLVVCFFVAFPFAILIPTMKSSLLERKREMIRELTNSAWSILAEYEREEREGRTTRAEAQQNAIARVEFLRYGREGKDYFWITDMHPRMVMHPYRKDLNGQDLSDFRDPDGVALFVEFVRAVEAKEHGHVDYVWQWKDDPLRLAAKQSYVRGFKPWGWVIGTGIYVEDVEKEIAAITGRVINFSFLITIGAGILLLVVAHQSLRIERRRYVAERDLRVSHEKYRALVEAATEGTLMVLDQRCTFANKTMLDMLGYTAEEIAFMDIHDMLPSDGDSAHPAATAIDSLMDGVEVAGPLEARLRRKDGSLLDTLLYPTRFSFAGRDGVILNARDVGGHKTVEEELGASREKYRALTEAINIGVFRAHFDSKGSFLEINQAGQRILGMSGEPVADHNLHAALADPHSFRQIFQTLSAEGSVKEMIVQLRKPDGALTTISLSAMVVLDEESKPRFCDGVFEDVSERRRKETERENLIAQLQSSLLFLSEPVRNSISPALTCPMTISIGEAAERMARENSSAIAVTTPEGDVAGIVTDHDLRERVVSRNLDSSRPVFEIMSSPVVSIPDWSPIYEAFLLMREKQVRHLVVTGSSGKISGMTRNKDLVRLDRYSAVVLTHEIQRAKDISELTRCHDRLPALVGSLVDSGALPRNISRIITAVSDAIFERVITFALNELGPAPARFSFLALGSEGREEQTMKTDQDNAIIYEDPPPDRHSEVADYFQILGEKVCEALNRVGYSFCRGDMMARNPKWNQPLKKWEETFTHWIVEPDSEELLKFNIVFDFRSVFGDAALAHELLQHIHSVLENRPPFFQHMARNMLLYKPPLGLFGQIVTGSGGADPDTFNIKDAMLPIVNFARLYALQHRIEETNTIDRINQLRAQNVLRQDSHRELTQAYGCLMQLRYKRQIEALQEGRKPGNSVNPKSLSQIEAGMVKEALSQISMIQKRVSFDFTGSG